MIISYKRKIVFIHIPKCGGTTIRNLIKDYDEKKREDIIKETEKKGLDLDIGHLPLFSIKQLLPDIFDVINKFDNYTIIRDPYERFVSSVSQHLGMYQGRQMKDLKYKQVLKETDKIINYLANNKREKILPKEYIHFQKQKDYIYYNSTQIVKNIYTINEIDTLIRKLKLKFAIDERAEVDEVTRSNQTKIYKNPLIKYLKIFLKKIQIYKFFKMLPLSIKQKINNYLYSDINNLRRRILAEKKVQIFIRTYYGEDIELFNNLSKNTKL